MARGRRPPRTWTRRPGPESPIRRGRSGLIRSFSSAWKKMKMNQKKTPVSRLLHPHPSPMLGAGQRDIRKPKAENHFGAFLKGYPGPSALRVVIRFSHNAKRAVRRPPSINLLLGDSINQGCHSGGSRNLIGLPQEIVRDPGFRRDDVSVGLF